MSRAEPLTAPPTPRTDDDARRIFTTSVVVSGVRCLLTYIVFPWVLPLLGIARGVGPAVGIVIGTIAIGFNVVSLRRFWIARHPWRWMITFVNVTAIVLLTVLVAIDVSELV